MKLFVSALIISSLAASAIAADADPAQMAAEVGFTGCDAFIRKTFEHALKSPDRRINVANFNETKSEAVTLTATFGLPGDSVLQTVTFTKEGTVCFSVMTGQISQQGNCTEILVKEDKVFSLVATQGDTLWTKNGGGVLKFYRQVGPFCLQTFRVDTTSKDRN